jgi:hypothetical protein
MTPPEAQRTAITVEMDAMREAILGDNFTGEIHLVYFDLETDGLVKRDEPMPHILEIAAAHSASVTAINNIDNDMVASSPPFNCVARSFVHWVESFCCEQDIVIFLYLYTGDLETHSRSSNKSFQT